MHLRACAADRSGDLTNQRRTRGREQLLQTRQIRLLQAVGLRQVQREAAVDKDTVANVFIKRDPRWQIGDFVPTIDHAVTERY